MFRVLLLAIAATMLSGCAALSLFSTTHEHHYENNPDVNTRLAVLEAKVDTLEKAIFPGRAGEPVVAPALK